MRIHNNIELFINVYYTWKTFLMEKITFSSFLFRLKRFTRHFLKNPLSIIRIFNLRTLFRVFKHLTNVEVNFQNLSKDYQISVLQDTFSKIDEILDKNLTNNKLQEINIDEIENKYLNDKNHEKLKNLFNKFGSDKSDKLHSFVYFYIFENFKINSIFEIGLGTNNIKIRSNMGIDGKPGASLRAFRDFLDIKVYGADIDKNILFQEKNIETFYIDQLDRNSIKNIRNLIPKVDLIIDDGLHQPDANLNSIIDLLEHLNPKGILVIEDIGQNFLYIFKIIGKIYNINYYNSKIIKMKKNYCFLIQKLK